MASESIAHIPATVDELFEPTWLVDALDDLDADAHIVRVESTDTSKTRAEKLRFAVTVEDGEGRRVQYYCAKAHLDGTPSGGLISEARFYRDIAPRLDVRRPRVPYVAIDADRGAAIIVMEDVVAGGGLFMNPHRPMPVDAVRDSLSQLALLHASTWGLTSVDDVEWLNTGRFVLSGAFPAEMLQTLLDDGRADGLPPELHSGEHLAAALQLQAQRPVTCMLHGDTHTGNLYLDASGRACFFDWEVVQQGNWSQDVAYHLSTVLSIDDRRGERTRTATPLPRRARGERRARARRRGSLGAVPAQLRVRLSPVGHHAHPRP